MAVNISAPMLALTASVMASNNYHASHEKKVERVIYKPYVPQKWKDFYTEPCSREHVEYCKDGINSIGEANK